ncbi:hypothetical protein [Nocardioides sp. YIM 152315]|uniref:hypothetical protein n=1 Tax=Nocardioides sp. YIM 152315 TaxID=3031760 RepID=UPI0023DBFF77|nr:hypothetical protein [Nocardioides sp. YIM 152315]MDF1602121.1 hypothetical protein [Nocardioides sp. YIM 152315]
MAPPENAIVLCVDEKPQIQALERTVLIAPMQEGRIERRSHDYYRYGTSTSFAALDTAAGQVKAAFEEAAPSPGAPGVLEAGRAALSRDVDDVVRPVECTW